MLLEVPLALLAVGFVQGAEHGWSRLREKPNETLAFRRVKERGGGRLVVRDDGVLRIRRDQQTELECLQPEGTGVIRALIPDPAGLTFVVAEHGLYLVSPEVDVLDPVELGDGAPPGSPTSAVFDSRRRLWYATDVAFGCIDPSFFHGRTIQVPAPGPYNLVPDDDPIGITLSTGDGSFVYSTVAGDPPRVDQVIHDRKSLVRNQLLEVDYSNPLSLEATGTGFGGATFRYSVDRHHRWLALEDGTEIRIEPGEHLLEIVALDQDLRPSEPFPLRVVVAYPIYYRRGFALAVGLLVIASIYAVFRVLDRNLPPRIRRQRVAVSTVLASVLGLQVLAGIVPHARGWPFMGYAMYSQSLDVGHVSYNCVLVGVTDRGKTVRIPLGALGVAADNRWQVLGPLIRGCEEPNRAAIERLNGDRPKARPLRRLQVWAERTRLTETGPVAVAQLVLSDYEHPREGAGDG